ncbi:hypothetical protein [Frigoribacterium salinisoli]
MTSTTLPVQPAPLAGNYVSTVRPTGTGSYVSAPRDLRTIGSYVSVSGARDVTLGRYTRSARRQPSAVTRVVRTVTGSIRVSRTAQA